MIKLYIILGVVLIVLSGASNGVHETLVWHPNQFEAKFPNANPQYWNPYQSYTNKCKQGEGYNPDVKCVPKFFGADSFLVFLTDAKHLFSELHRDLLILGVVLLTLGIFGSSWRWKVLIILATAYIAQGIGFYLIYTLYF